MADSAEKKEEGKPEGISEETFEKGIDLILDYIIHSCDVMDMLQSSTRGPAAAYGALCVALRSLELQFPQYAKALETTKEIVDKAISGKDGAELLQKSRDYLKQQKKSKVLEVLDAILIVPKFKFGDVMFTEAVKQAVPPERMGQCLRDHGDGNWGPFLSYEEKARNDQNMALGSGKLYSVHRIDAKKEDGPDNKFYIITEPDRSKTHVLMPQDQ
jgi:hypothetical protein